jgi:hypothetical protein
MSELRGPGRAIFAAILLMVGRVPNVIYGVAAVSDSSFFERSTG